MQRQCLLLPKAKVVDPNGRWDILIHGISRYLRVPHDTSGVLLLWKALKRHCEKHDLREENKETDKKCILSNCPESHLSSQVQWQSYHDIWTVSQALSIPFFFFFWCSVTQSCLTLCDSMYSKNRGLTYPSNLPEFSQTHDLWVSDALQPSCPLLFLSSPVLNLSQHQFLSSDFAFGLRWPIYWHFMFSISTFENNQRWFPSCFMSLNSMLTTELSYVSATMTVAKHQYFVTQFLWSCSLLHVLLLKINFDCSDLFQ